MTAPHLIAGFAATALTVLVIGGLTFLGWRQAQRGCLPVLHQEIARP